MNKLFSKKIALFALSAAILLAPFSASAKSPTGGNWLSSLFGWQKPLLSGISSIFETRKDSVESNSIARNQLLDWKRGVVSMDASSTDVSSDASTSPIFIPAVLFEEKKSSMEVELIAAEKSLRTNESDLASFISDSAANGNDMSAAQNSLDQADADIENADSAIRAFTAYEPDISTSTDQVDLTTPEHDLNAAVAALHTARASLTKAIAAANGSL